MYILTHQPLPASDAPGFSRPDTEMSEHRIRPLHLSAEIVPRENNLFYRRNYFYAAHVRL